MINRRQLLLTLGAGALVAPFASAVELHDKKMPRIGYLSVATAERDMEWLNAFRQGLKHLGYTAGKNIAIEVRHAAGYTERLLPLAMMMAFNRPAAPTVVAAGAVSAPAGGPVINVSNRIGRRW